MEFDYKSFARISLAKWELKQCVILDWQDAPIEGFCEMVYPKICFYFKAYAINSSARTYDDYLYKIYLSNNSERLNGLLEALKYYEEPKYPFWNPLWNFESETRELLDLKINKLIGYFKKQPVCILQTKDMINFKRLWEVLG
jgi:hypothetical protein